MFRPTALHLRVTATQDRRNATLEAGTSRRPATHEMNARAHHRIRSGTYAREHFPMTANAALMGAEGWRLRYQIPRTPHGRPSSADSDAPLYHDVPRRTCRSSHLPGFVHVASNRRPEHPGRRVGLMTMPTAAVLVIGFGAMGSATCITRATRSGV
jgi:hypothetical protein